MAAMAKLLNQRGAPGAPTPILPSFGGNSGSGSQLFGGGVSGQRGSSMSQGVLAGRGGGQQNFISSLLGGAQQGNSGGGGGGGFKQQQQQQQGVNPFQQLMGGGELDSIYFNVFWSCSSASAPGAM